jgi:5'-nucleotidase
VPYDVAGRLVIGIASSALFDLAECDAVFVREGEDAYRRHQEEHLDDPLGPGVAFPFIQGLLSLNDLTSPEDPLVEVIVLSHNDPDTGLRVMRSIARHGLGITRAIFMQGRSPYHFMPALNMSLFLSANEEDALPQLRRHWDRQPAAPGSRPGPFRFTAPEREAFYRHAARQAETAADQIRRSAGGDPPRPPTRPGRRPPRSMPPPERSVIRHCAGPPTRSTGPRGPPTGRSRPGPQRETGSGPPPGSSPWQAAARPAPRRPRFT